MFKKLTSLVVSAAVLTLSSVVLAGPLGGIERQETDVGAYQTDTYNVYFAPGLARVRVQGDGDTDLDCYLIQGNGAIASKDDDATDQCLMIFTVVTLAISPLW
jgi:hypothetical protein